jgi:hypothetical protein
MMNELLTCIKLIKMYAWEKSFAKAIAGISHVLGLASNITN